MIVHNTALPTAKLSFKVNSNEANSIFGNHQLTQTVLYMDVDIEIESSTDLADIFTEAIATMKDTRTVTSKYDPTARTNSDFLSKYNSGNQTALWNDVVSEKDSNSLLDTQDLLNFFNEDELIPGEDELKSLFELETKLRVYLTQKNFSKRDLHEFYITTGALFLDYFGNNLGFEDMPKQLNTISADDKYYYPTVRHTFSEIFKKHM